LKAFLKPKFSQKNNCHKSCIGTKGGPGQYLKSLRSRKV